MIERTVKLMVLDKWFKVSEPQFDEIMDFVEGAVEELAAVEYSGTMTVKAFYGVFWDDYSHYQRRLIDRCVAYMVKNGMLELEMAGSPRTKPNRYKLTNYKEQQNAKT